MLKIEFNKKFISLLSNIAVDAGKKILLEYNKKKINYKNDGSPVTNADKVANEYIVKLLKKYNSKIPILSEESPPNVGILESDFFWAVDPLDGTKEFISNSPNYTVNIALIKNKHPIFGVVYAPISDILWMGYHNSNSNSNSKINRNKNYISYKLSNASIAIMAPTQDWKKICVSKKPKIIKILTSKSHRSNKLNGWISLNYKNEDIQIKEIGSSLKICLIADGSAHLYPRFGRTCIWDTAAAHAVINGSGGSITILGSDLELQYDKNIYNPEFLVSYNPYK